MTTYQIIHDAIAQRRIVKATYRGRLREMCPHVLGMKKGRSQTLCYQFAGDSSTGLEPDGSPNNWRCMFLDELSNVSIHDGPWHTAPNHSRPQRCVDQIDVEVTY